MFSGETGVDYAGDRQELERIEFGPDPQRDALAVLEEILPLDQRRKREGRVQLAFAMRARAPARACSEAARVLGDLHRALRTALAAAGAGSPQQSLLAAHAGLALADGLALHALSTANWLTPRDIRGAVDLVLSQPSLPVAVPTRPGRT